jgi:hypothetical protein
MKQAFYLYARATAMLMVASLVLAAGCRSGENATNISQAKPVGETQPQAQANFDEQRQNAEKQARPEVEKERQSAQEQANQALDQDAIAAINDTQNAIKAISQSNKNDALAAIEAATGKIDILLARNAKAALIPVASEVEVIDTAPFDEKAVQALNNSVSEAVKDKNYPTARLLLYSLESEIRARTYNLPLATYPLALQEAARLLDQGKNDDASRVLGTALNTMVAVDKVTPIPLVLARAAIAAAEEQRQKDKNAAETLLSAAKDQLHRCQELGYAANATEYSALNTSIAQLDKELKGNGDTTSLFARLKDELSPLFNRQSAQERR